MEFTPEEKTILVQYAIKKFEEEDVVIERLGALFDKPDIQQNIDTLIGTQRVRRIGPEVLQNNESHTELPELPPHLGPILDKL